MKPKSTTPGCNSESETGRLTLDRFLPYRLNVAATVVSEGLAKLYGDRFGISIPEWRIIATLGEYSKMTGKQISAHTRMNKVKVSRAVAALESRGMLARQANSDDRREEFLSLSHAGKDAYSEIAPLALAYQKSVTDLLTPDDYAAFDRILAKLTSLDKLG